MSVNFAELVEPRMFQAGGKVAGLKQAASVLWDKYNRGKTVQPGMFSTLDELIADAPFDEVPADQWRKYLKPGRMLRREGVQFPLKKEELAQSGGLEQFLDLRAGERVSKDEVRRYLQAGRPRYKVDVARELYDDQATRIHDSDADIAGLRSNPVSETWEAVGLEAPTRSALPLDRVARKAAPMYGVDFASAEGTPVFHHVSPGSTYDESITRMPGLEGTSHFTPDALVWSRTTSHDMLAPSGYGQGRIRVRLVEEIQSDVHRKAASKVWVDHKTGQNYFNEDLVKEKIQKGELDPEFLETGERIGYRTEEDALQLAGIEEELKGLDDIVDMTPVDDDDLAAINNAGRDKERLRAIAARLEAKVDDAPYKDPSDYAALELRKQLWNAADEGEDYLALTRGADQIERYATEEMAAGFGPGDPYEKLVRMRKGMREMYDEVYAGELRKLAKRFGLTVEDIELEVMARAPTEIAPPRAGTVDNPFSSLMVEIREADVSPEATAHFDEVWDELDELVGELTPGDYHMPMHSKLSELQDSLTSIKDFVGANFDDMKSGTAAAVRRWDDFEVEKALGNWGADFEETMNMWTNLQNQGPVPEGIAAADELVKKTFPAIRLTPEGREKILRIGVQQYGKGGKVEALKRLWRIWDPKESQWASSTYKNKRRARNKIDKMDNEYGAYRYKLKEVRDTKDPKGTTAFQRGGKVELGKLMRELKRRFEELGGVDEGPDDPTRRRVLAGIGATAIAAPAALKQARYQARPEVAPAVRSAVREAATARAPLKMEKPLWDLGEDMEEDLIRNLMDEGGHGGSEQIVKHFAKEEFKQLEADIVEAGREWGSHRYGGEGHLESLDKARDHVKSELWDAGMPERDAEAAARQVMDVDWPEFKGFEGDVEGYTPTRSSIAQFETEIEGPDDLVRMLNKAREGESLAVGSEFNTFSVVPEGASEQFLKIGRMEVSELIDELPRFKHGVDRGKPIQAVGKRPRENWRQETDRWRRWLQNHPRETWIGDWATRAELELDKAEGGAVKMQRGGKVEALKALLKKAGFGDDVVRSVDDTGGEYGRIDFRDYDADEDAFNEALGKAEALGAKIDSTDKSITVELPQTEDLGTGKIFEVERARAEGYPVRETPSSPPKQDLSITELNKGTLSISEENTIDRFLREYTGKDLVSMQGFPDPERPGIYAVRAHDPHQGGEAMEFIIDTNVEDMMDGIEEVEFGGWPPKSSGKTQGFAEGGRVDAFENTKRRLALAMVMGSGRLPDEAEIQERMARLTADDDDGIEFGFGDKSGLEIAKSTLQSIVGAIPGVGEEGAEYGAETLMHFPASFTSQVKTLNPKTGEAEWHAGYSAPPWEMVERGIMPLEEWKELKETADRLSEEHPVRPGMIDETSAILNIFGTGPEWSKEAEERQFALRGAILEDYGLDDPSGFLQHLASAGGTMAGQVPIPMGTFTRLKALAGKLPKVAKWGSALGRWPVEWLSPVIEPSLLTYGAASLFGASIGTGVEAMLGEEELEPEEAERMLADMMQESEVEQIMPPDETDARIDEDIERRLGMRPGQYTEDLPSAF